jgi:hypothetical protein
MKAKCKGLEPSSVSLECKVKYPKFYFMEIAQ